MKAVIGLLLGAISGMKIEQMTAPAPIDYNATAEAMGTLFTEANHDWTVREHAYPFGDANHGF